MAEIPPNTAAPDIQVVARRHRRAVERRQHWEGLWRFSCWNPDDPNRAKLLSVASENRAFRTCLRIARRAAHGELDDPTRGATHYHARHVNPPWSRGRAASAEIGRHLFYNDVE